MLYLIGLGLNVDGISKFGLEMVKKCKRVYLEEYTVNFPYSMQELQDALGKRFEVANREKVESLEIVDEAKRMEVALLVYGSPLTATTHITLIEEAKNSGIKVKVIYNASIFDAVAETGLQLYKFGKTASMPKWDIKKNFSPDSFMKIVQENQSMKAHSLILCDIGLYFDEAMKQLEQSAKNNNFSLKKIIVCSRLSAKYQKIIYDDFENIKEMKIQAPYCIIIPSKLHFMEKEVLERFERE
jgi:diphthine synthase